MKHKTKELSSSFSLLGKKDLRWVSTVPAHHNTLLFKKTFAQLSPEFEVKQMIVGKGDINDEVDLLIQETRKELKYFTSFFLSLFGELWNKQKNPMKILRDIYDVKHIAEKKSK